MRSERLLTLLLLLQNYGKMKTRELAERLEVSERTICRDMDALSAAGIPVVAQRGYGGGWKLLEGYRTRLTGMKAEELLSLILAHPTGLMEDLGLRKDFEAAWEKLRVETPISIQQSLDRARERIHIDGAGWHPFHESTPSLTTAQEAVWMEQKLTFRYPRGEAWTERIVRPLGLVAKRNIWYLVAETDDGAGTNNGIRTFRISRMEDARLMDETFERPVDFRLADYWEKSVHQFKSNLPSYPATIAVAESHLQRLKQERYVGILNCTPPADGWVVAEVDCQTLDSACQIFLGYGASLKVLSPVELRKKVRHTAEEMILLYKE